MGWLSNLFGAKPTRISEIQGDGEFDCEVVGESNYQDALSRITGGKTSDGHSFECTALLLAEPNNRHDPNAVVVQIQGETVGYLPRHHAKQIAAVFRKNNLAGAEAGAIVVGGWTGRGGRKAEGHFGVRLDIPVKG